MQQYASEHRNFQTHTLCGRYVAKVQGAEEKKRKRKRETRKKHYREKKFVTCTCATETIGSFTHSGRGVTACRFFFFFFSGSVSSSDS